MIDIVDRLRFDAARCEATLSKGVASNIEEAVAEFTRLRARVEELEAALGPFAARAKEIDDREYDANSDSVKIPMRLGDLRRARAALQEGE